MATPTPTEATTARNGDVVVIQDVVTQQFVGVDLETDELLMVPVRVQAKEFRLSSRTVCFGRSIRETCGFQLTHREDGDFHVVFVEAVGPTFDLAFQRQTMALPELATNGCRDYRVHYGDAYEIRANGSLLQNINDFVVADAQTLSGQVSKFKFELIEQAKRSDGCSSSCKTKCRGGGGSGHVRHDSDSDTDTEDCCDDLDTDDTCGGAGAKKSHTQQHGRRHRTAKTGNVIWILIAVVGFIIALGLLLWWMYSKGGGNRRTTEAQRTRDYHVVAIIPQKTQTQTEAAVIDPPPAFDDADLPPPPPPPQMARKSGLPVDI